MSYSILCYRYIDFYAPLMKNKLRISRINFRRVVKDFPKSNDDLTACAFARNSDINYLNFYQSASKSFAIFSASIALPNPVNVANEYKF